MPQTFSIVSFIFCLFLIALSALNVYLIVRNTREDQDAAMSPEMRRNSILQKLIAGIPFCVTTLYCLVYECSRRNEVVYKCFRDLFTFLGFPLTALHFINLMLHSVQCILDLPSSYIVFPVVFDILKSSGCVSLNYLVVVLNCAACICMLGIYGCLAPFKPHGPIMMFTFLFLGVLLDRFALMNRNNFSHEDLQFIISLVIQILIVDTILVLLSCAARKFFGEDENCPVLPVFDDGNCEKENLDKKNEKRCENGSNKEKAVPDSFSELSLKSGQQNYHLLINE